MRGVVLLPQVVLLSFFQSTFSSAHDCQLPVLEPPGNDDSIQLYASVMSWVINVVYSGKPQRSLCVA